jgi:hypothetical protein
LVPHVQSVKASDGEGPIALKGGRNAATDPHASQKAPL